MIVEINFL